MGTNLFTSDVDSAPYRYLYRNVPQANDVGANLFIGQLDPDVDEKMLYDTFSAFGFITQTPKVMRDPDTGMSKGYGFVSYDG